MSPLQKVLNFDKLHIFDKFCILCSKCLCIRQIKKMQNLQKDVVLHFKTFRSGLMY